MAPIRILTDKERADLSVLAPRWRISEDGKSMQRRFNFRDFSNAWGFMSRVALLVVAHQHHPDWTNLKNQVVIMLTSRDVHGLTQRDMKMALAIDALLTT
jgi:4a-hydroxytetrahydrobiopterin dehydratase